MKKTTRILKMCAKCRDMCAMVLEINGKNSGDYDDYVPDFFPENHYGDYIEFHIDIDSGVIVNWKRPTKVQLKKLNLI